jgi:hypothetical protein
MANERDFSFKCIKIALIVIHSLSIILLIVYIVVLAAVANKSVDLSPEGEWGGENFGLKGKDTTRKFIHSNS